MANKKRNKKRRPPSRATGSGQAAQGRAGDPERAARKEEARRQRQRELKRARQRRKATRAALYAGAAALAVLLIFLVVRSGTPKAPTSKTLDRLIAAAPAAAKAAGCGDVKDVGPYNPPSEDHAHIGAQVQSPPSLTTYPSVPPASGPHDPTPQGARVYASSPDIYKMIHSLEHGAVEIWYAPSVPQSSLTADENFVKQYQDHTIMSPYNYPGEGTSSTLPQGMQFALVSWQKVQLCSGVPGTAVLANFMAKYRFPTLGGGTFQGSNDPKLEKGAAI